METRSHLEFGLGKLALGICLTGILFCSIGQAQAEQRVIPLKRMSATEAAKAIKFLFDSNEGIGVDERTNCLVIENDDPEILKTIEELIGTLDAPLQQEQEDNFLKRELKYVPAAEFLSRAAAAIEHALGGDAKPQPAPKPQAAPQKAPDSPESILVGKTLLIADPQLNNVIVSGAPEHVRLIGRLADEIDVKPRQVYIKAIVARVALSDDLKFGFDVLREGRFAKADLGDDPNNGIDLLASIDAEGHEKDDRIELVDVSKQLSGGASAVLELTHPGDPLAGPLLAIGRGLELYLGILADQSDEIEIVTSTHVVADNNSKESIISAIEDLELTVTPLINSKDEVTLTIETELVTPTEGDPESTSIQSFNTRVRLPDRAATVTGGIIQKKDGERKELLIFIQPWIFPEGKVKVDVGTSKAKRVEDE